MDNNNDSFDLNEESNINLLGADLAGRDRAKSDDQLKNFTGTPAKR